MAKSKIIIKEAKTSETLDDEWAKVNVPHYGNENKWVEKRFRYKAELKGELVGTIDGKYESGVIYISALITKEATRGLGIGTKLVEQAEKFGKQNGAHIMWLVTGKDWSENAFYQKLGFKIIGEIPNFHFHKDFVIYTREII